MKNRTVQNLKNGSEIHDENTQDLLYNTVVLNAP